MVLNEILLRHFDPIINQCIITRLLAYFISSIKTLAAHISGSYQGCISVYLLHFLPTVMNYTKMFYKHFFRVK